MDDSPDRSDFRLIKKICSSTLSKLDADPRPKELEKISRVFLSAGGSWVKVFRGSIQDIVLLKDLVKVAIEGGYVTKKPDWSS